MNLSFSKALLLLSCLFPLVVFAQEGEANFPNWVAYYSFTNSIKNSMDANSKAKTDVVAPLSLNNTTLRSSGSYKEYFANRGAYPYMYCATPNSSKGFTFSINFKLSTPEETGRMAHIVKISGQKRDINLYRSKEGYLLFEYDNYSSGEEISELYNVTNTKLPFQEWCNVTFSYNPNKLVFEIYLNGVAVAPLKVAHSPWSAESLSFAFVNGRRGIVLKGEVERLTIFNSYYDKEACAGVAKFMSKFIGNLGNLIDPNVIVNNGTDNPDKLLGIAGLTSYYHFKNNINNQVKADKYLFSVKAPFSYKDGALYVSGSYEEYYDYSGDEVIQVPTKDNQGNFTFSINVKNEEPEEGYWGRTIAKIKVGKQVLILSRYKEGYLTLEFNVYVDQKIETRSFVFKNTNMYLDKWCNITLSFNQDSRKAQVYLNGTALSTASISGFDLSNTEQDAICTFANRGNGSVFKGYIQKLAVFNRALNATEVNALVKKLTTDIVPLSDMITGSNETRSETTFDIEEHWTYLPGCVAGDKAKKVEVHCQNGADLSYLISADKAETTFFVIENAFSPALENTESTSFESCLGKLKKIAAGRCR